MSTTHDGVAVLVVAAEAIPLVCAPKYVEAQTQNFD